LGIFYRLNTCEDRKYVLEFRGDFGAHRQSLTSSFRRHRLSSYDDLLPKLRSTPLHFYVTVSSPIKHRQRILNCNCLHQHHLMHRRLTKAPNTYLHSFNPSWIVRWFSGGKKEKMLGPKLLMYVAIREETSLRTPLNDWHSLVIWPQ
jgi:hypothetical protein